MRVYRLSPQMLSGERQTPMALNANPFHCQGFADRLMLVSQGKVTPNQDYNPLDLFSRDTARMQPALKALLQNPQNNLRLFLDGESVAPDAFGPALRSALGVPSNQAALATLATLVSATLLKTGGASPLTQKGMLFHTACPGSAKLLWQAPHVLLHPYQGRKLFWHANKHVFA